jgi:hypothetical protein
MIAPGTSVSVKNRALKTTDSKEIQYLYDILHAIRNEGGLLSAILEALGGSATHYNIVLNYDVSNDTETLTAGTVHSLSFSVISGSISVSFDGGSTSITYPAGYNRSITASTTFSDDIVFTAATGSDRVIVGTLTA